MTRSVAVAYAADYFDSGAHLACAQHAPDEHLLAPLARRALQLMATLYWNVGEISTYLSGSLP